MELTIDKTLGYAYFMEKGHPLADKKGRVWYHRFVASKKIGRWLRPEEIAHHVNEDRSDNSEGNIEVLPNQAEHARRHHAEKGHFARPVKACAVCGEESRNKRYCSPECSAKGSRRVKRPGREVLVEMLRMESVCAVARRFGVTDNAVRKWLK